MSSALSFSLSDGERELVERVSAFARAEVAPGAEERIRERRFDRELWRRAAEAGLTGIGLEGDAADPRPRVLPACLALEALQAEGGDGGFSLSVAAHVALCVFPLARLGSAEQRRELLPRLASGEAIGALAITEPGHGSDATGIETTAVAVEGGGYRLDGVKAYVTNGSVADVLVVLARSGPGDLGFGLSAFLVEPRTSASVHADDVRLAGFHSARISTVTLRATPVPADRLLGRSGAGFHTVARVCFDLERSIMLAPVVGEMRRCLDVCLDYASTRRSGGHAIVTHGQVQRRLAGMKTRLESARWAVYRAAWEQDEGIRDPASGPIAKKVVAEAALANAADAIQVMGAAGALEDGPVARSLHEARLAAIAGGTIELQEQALVAAMIDRRRT